MPIELVYDGKNLTIPKRMLPESGVPFEHHFKSIIGDNLIELAGRACYDSCKSEKTRASFDYHQHILDVNHTSVQEHLNITVEFPMMNREINDFILWTCLNRPGVWVCGNPQTQNVRITANIRSIREWDKWNNNLVDPNVQSAVGVAMKRFGQQIAPMTTADVSHGDAFPEAKLVEPIFPQEKWLSFYIYDVSRGCTHELVRHKWQTAISQRSTRYVDESESDWIYHPLFEKYREELSNLPSHNQEKAFQAHLINPWCVAPIAKGMYNLVVDKLQELLIKDGIDKQTARKQSRGAARGLLGNALSTELIWSCSLAAALNIIKQRASAAADSEIRNLANGLYEIIQPLYPEYLSSFVKGECPDGIGYSLEMK